MSALVPIRWGFVEASRALSVPRLAAALAFAFAPLLAFQVDPFWVGLTPLWLVGATPLIIALSPPSGVAMPTPEARSWAGWAGGLARAGLATALAAAVCGGWAWATPDPTAHEALEAVVLGVASLALVAAALRQRVSAPPAALAILAPVLLVVVEVSGVLLLLLLWGLSRAFELTSPPPALSGGLALLLALGFHAVLSFTRLPGPEVGS